MRQSINIDDVAFLPKPFRSRAGRGDSAALDDAAHRRKWLTARDPAVEDDVLIGMMLADMFDALGLPEPAQAASKNEALAIIAAEPLGGALVDINLGEGLAGGRRWPNAVFLCLHLGRG